LKVQRFFAYYYILLSSCFLFSLFCLRFRLSRFPNSTPLFCPAELYILIKSFQRLGKGDQNTSYPECYRKCDHYHYPYQDCCRNFWVYFISFKFLFFIFRFFFFHSTTLLFVLFSLYSLFENLSIQKTGKNFISFSLLTLFLISQFPFLTPPFLILCL